MNKEWQQRKLVDRLLTLDWMETSCTKVYRNKVYEREVDFHFRFVSGALSSWILLGSLFTFKSLEMLDEDIFREINYEKMKVTLSKWIFFF